MIWSFWSTLEHFWSLPTSTRAELELWSLLELVGAYWSLLAQFVLNLCTCVVARHFYGLRLFG